MNATFSNEVKEIKANREVELDLTQMPVGTYVIQVQGEHVRKTLKIVKQ
jgi:allantoicase